MKKMTVFLLLNLLLTFCTVYSQSEWEDLSIDSLLSLGQSYYKTNIDSAIFYSNLAYNKALRLKDTSSIARSIGYKSTYLLSQKRHEEAIALLQFNLDNKTSLEFEDLGVTYNNLGIIHNLMEDDDKAIEYYLKALETFEVIQHNRQLARVNLNLGIVYEKKELLKQADYFYNESMYYSKRNNNGRLDQLHDDLGGETRSSYNKNVEFARAALEEIDDPTQSRLAGIIYHDLSENHLKYGYYDLAEETAKQSIEAKLNSRFTQNIDYTYFLLGKAQVKLNKATEGTRHLLKAIELSNKQELKLLMYDEVVNGLKKMNQYETALVYSERRSRLRDSLDQITENAIIAEITAKFENEKQANEILILKQEAQNKELLIAQNEIKIWRWSLIALLSTLLAVYFGRRYLKSLKRVREIEEERDEIVRKVEKEFLELNNKNKVYLDELRYIKSEGNYLTFHQDDKRIMDRNRLKDILEELPPNFVKIHRSYIVNKNAISAINHNSLLLNSGEELPLSRTFKTNLKL